MSAVALLAWQAVGVLGVLAVLIVVPAIILTLVPRDELDMEVE